MKATLQASLAPQLAQESSLLTAPHHLLPTAYICSNQIMGWGEKAIEIRSVETGHLDGVFMHKRAQRLKFLCERNDKVGGSFSYLKVPGQRSGGGNGCGVFLKGDPSRNTTYRPSICLTSPLVLRTFLMPPPLGSGRIPLPFCGLGEAPHSHSAVDDFLCLSPVN